MYAPSFLEETRAKQTNKQHAHISKMFSGFLEKQWRAGRAGPCRADYAHGPVCLLQRNYWISSNQLDTFKGHLLAFFLWFSGTGSLCLWSYSMYYQDMHQYMYVMPHAHITHHILISCCKDLVDPCQKIRFVFQFSMSSRTSLSCHIFSIMFMFSQNSPMISVWTIV